MAVLAPQQLTKLKQRLEQDSRWLRSTYYVETKIFMTGDIIPIALQEGPADTVRIMVFVDDDPGANWGHECRYLLFEQNLEQFRTIDSRFPPYFFADQPPATYIQLHPEVGATNPPFFVSPPNVGIAPFAPGQRYAILFSGGSNYRHVNDMEFLYRTLRNRYAFPAANIKVFNFDGVTPLSYAGLPKPITNWPGNSSRYEIQINGAGTRDNFLNELKRLKTVLRPNDSLFIHVNNHGDYDALNSESYIVCNYTLLADRKLTADQFAQQLGELQGYASLMVMLEQCSSGGFIQPILNHCGMVPTSVATACRENTSSYGDDFFNYFAMSWISAMAGQTPHGTVVPLGTTITAKQAFNHAYSIRNSKDSPEFDSRNGGEHAVLGDTRLHWPFLPHLEQLLLEFWPMGDPHFVKELEKLLPQLRELETAMSKQLLKTRQDYLEKLADILPAKSRVK